MYCNNRKDVIIREGQVYNMIAAMAFFVFGFSQSSVSRSYIIARSRVLPWGIRWHTYVNVYPFYFLFPSIQLCLLRMMVNWGMGGA